VYVIFPIGPVSAGRIKVISKAPTPPLLSSIPGSSSTNSAHESSGIDAKYLDSLARSELQSLAKEHGVPANLASAVIIEALHTLLASDPAQQR
jgi:hypothetical protein